MVTLYKRPNCIHSATSGKCRSLKGKKASLKVDPLEGKIIESILPASPKLPEKCKNISEQKIRRHIDYYNHSNHYDAGILAISNAGQYPSYLFILNPGGSAWHVSFLGNNIWRGEMRSVLQ